MPPTDRTRLSVKDHDGIALVGFLDSRIVADEDVQQVGDQLYQLFDAGRHERIVIDFGKVKFMSSALLGKLMHLKKRVDAAGGWLRLCGIDRNLSEIFRVSHLDKLFAIFETEQEALRA